LCGSAVTSQAQSENWEAPAAVSGITNHFANNPEAIEQGEVRYTSMCAVCHGKKGKGDGIAGMNLVPRPTDLTSKKVKEQSDGALFWKLTTGKPPMAAYKDILTLEERWQLVTYIRSLSKK